MNKNILAIHGSPRKNGNSIYLANQAISIVKNQNVTVEQINLNDVEIKPCNGCDACRKGKKRYCSIKDGMQNLYEKVIKADALLLTSPIYWFTYSGQLKIFIDRLYAVQTEAFSALKGKKIGIILTYADTNPFSSGVINAIRTLKDMFNYTESNILGIVYGTAWAIGDAEKNSELINQARDLGRKLVSFD